MRTTIADLCSALSRALAELYFTHTFYTA